MSCDWCEETENLTKCSCDRYYCDNHEDYYIFYECPHCDKLVCFECGLKCAGCIDNDREVRYCKDVAMCEGSVIRIENGLRFCIEDEIESIANCSVCITESEKNGDTIEYLNLLKNNCQNCIDFCESCNSPAVDGNCCYICDKYLCRGCYIINQRSNAVCCKCIGFSKSIFKKYKDKLKIVKEERI
jgi:hypothetical protein